MVSKPPVAVYDACVLYPFHLRNVLIQCAFDGLVAARWTDAIHAEWIRNLTAAVPALEPARLEVTRDRMKAVLPDADVADYERLVPELSLPDPDDRHVLAAAIAARAQVIVTWNLKDFPASALVPYGVVALSPDDFLVGLYEVFPKALIASIAGARRNLKKSLPTVTEFIDALDRQGLIALGAILRSRGSRLF